MQIRTHLLTLQVKPCKSFPLVEKKTIMKELFNFECSSTSPTPTLGRRGSSTAFHQGQNDFTELQSMGSLSTLSMHGTPAFLANDLKEKVYVCSFCVNSSWQCRRDLRATGGEQPGVTSMVGTSSGPPSPTVCLVSSPDDVQTSSIWVGRPDFYLRAVKSYWLFLKVGIEKLRE